MSDWQHPPQIMGCFRWVACAMVVFYAALFLRCRKGIVAYFKQAVRGKMDRLAVKNSKTLTLPDYVFFWLLALSILLVWVLNALIDRIKTAERADPPAGEAGKDDGGI